MHSFYTRRSQKCKQDSQLKQLLVLSGSAGIKAAHKLVDEIDPLGFPGYSRGGYIPDKSEITNTKSAHLNLK